MRTSRAEIKSFLLGSALVLCSPLFAVPADASSDPQQNTTAPPHYVSGRVSRGAGSGFHASSPHNASLLASARHRATPSYGISCVPYAREASGIFVAGNAWQWWENASGQYARGYRPEPGSVLAFRSTGRMRLGHVAVVTRVVNAREVIVDHANWPSSAMYGGVSRDVMVVDVSEANNWSAVRVQLSRTADFGSIYPTYGFIYNRPDNGMMTASVARPTPQPAINRVPSDLRPAAERPWHTFEEVAESPAGPRRQVDLRLPSTIDTP
jgi:surface antigen